MQRAEDRRKTPITMLMVFVLNTLLWASSAALSQQPPLERIQTIQLKGPHGRLDHLALDTRHARLFVANMANSSLDIVDLKNGMLLKQIPGQKESRAIGISFGTSTRNQTQLVRGKYFWRKSSPSCTTRWSTGNRMRNQL